MTNKPTTAEIKKAEKKIMKKIALKNLVTGRTYHYKGLDYKLGIHGFIFYLINDEWQKSCMKENELVGFINLEIIRKEKRRLRYLEIDKNEIKQNSKNRKRCKT